MYPYSPMLVFGINIGPLLDTLGTALHAWEE